MIKRIKFRKNGTLFSDQILDFSKDSKHAYKYILLIGDNGVGKTTLINLFFDLQSTQQNIYKIADWVEFDNRDNWRKTGFDVGHDLPFRFASFICIPSLGIINTNTHQNYANDTKNNNWIALGKLLTSICERDREKFAAGESTDQYEQLHIFNSIANSFLNGKVLTLGHRYKSPGSNPANIVNSYTFYIDKAKQIKWETASSGLQKAIYWAAILYGFDENENGNAMHLVDEPENDWHPKLQKEFAKNFMPKSSNQILIATHSPFIVESFLKYHRNDTMLIWIQNESNKTKITYLLKDKKSILLPTISLAEINYLVYDIYSSDYHCMLYGYLQNLYVEEDEQFAILSKFDKKLIELVSEEGYIKTNDPHPSFTPKTSLMTYIRNCIDHPDNTERVTYTDDELKMSISKLRELIIQKRKEKTKK